MRFLTDKELTEVTGYKHRGKRIKALKQMQIPHDVNPVGRILVAEESIRARQ